MKPVSNYIVGFDLILKYDLKLFELFNCIKNGNLTPYDEHGKVAKHPNYASPEEIEKLEDEIKRNIDEGVIVPGNNVSSPLPPLVIGFSGAISGIRSFILESKLARYRSGPNNPFDWRQDLPENKEIAGKLLSALEKYYFRQDELDRIFSDNSNRKSGGEKPRLKSRKNQKYKKNIRLIMKIGSEAEAVYEAVVEAVGVTDKSINTRRERMDAAIEFLCLCNEDFEVLTEDHLSDLDLYTFKSNQTKRNFHRRLFKKVLESLNPGCTFSGSTALAIYRDTIQTGRAQ